MLVEPRTADIGRQTVRRIGAREELTLDIGILEADPDGAEVAFVDLVPEAHGGFPGRFGDAFAGAVNHKAARIVGVRGAVAIVAAANGEGVGGEDFSSPPST